MAASSSSSPNFNPELSLYQALGQQWVNAQQVRWTLLYNFLVASTVLLLVWVGIVSVDTTKLRLKLVVLFAICLAGILKSILWIILAVRGNRFVHMYDTIGQQQETIIQKNYNLSEWPFPFLKSDSLRSSLFPVTSRWVLLLIPLIFLVLYVVLFTASAYLN